MMKSPLAISGRWIVALIGKSMGRDYWRHNDRLYDDGSVLYSAMQKKNYRDVGRSAAGFVLSTPFALAGLISPMIDKVRVEEAVTCLICIMISLICFANFRSDLRNSQIIHVAGCPARDDPRTRAGITDDLFGEDDEDEDEEAADLDEDDASEDEGDEEYEESDPGNVVDFNPEQRHESSTVEDEPQHREESW